MRFSLLHWYHQTQRFNRSMPSCPAHSCFQRQTSRLGGQRSHLPPFRKPGIFIGEIARAV
jgi:hypothetical protein